MSDTPPNPARYSFFLLLLPLLGVFGIAALWVLVALWQDRMLTGFAFIVALDLILMVRLARLPRGPMRGVIAAGGTVLAILIANGWMMAARVGLLMGMMPWEGVTLMGPGFAWTLTQLANDGRDLVIYLAAVLLAGWWGR